MVTLKVLNKAFASLGIELVWGHSYGSGRYFYFLISDIEQCPLQFCKGEDFDNGSQLEESWGYGFPLNHITPTGWMEEAVSQLCSVAEHWNRGYHKFTKFEKTAMRMVLHDKLSKNYKVAETYKHPEPESVNWNHHVVKEEA